MSFDDSPVGGWWDATGDLKGTAAAAVWHRKAGEFYVLG